MDSLVTSSSPIQKQQIMQVPSSSASLPPLPSQPSSSSASMAQNHQSCQPLVRQCRICLLDTESRRKQLISPCRCTGTVRHVHQHCLAHWIEVSQRKMGAGPPQCELCGFRYRRRPFVNLARLHLPFMELRDQVLNALCLLLLLVMGLCAWVAAQHLQTIEKLRPSRQQQLSSSRGSRASSVSHADLTVLVAVLLLFAAFFLAMFTQYRAEVTLFSALSRLWATNRNWRIRNFDGHADGRRTGNLSEGMAVDEGNKMITRHLLASSQQSEQMQKNCILLK